MNSMEYARLKELFFAASERLEGERSAYLEAVCGADADLHRRLVVLLAAAREGDGFLEGPPEPPAKPGESNRIDAGARLGPWEIMREIGHGGMGTVYEARRAEGDFSRRAAVKLVRPEIATASFLRRFQMERRILAGLDHPHIARLLDAGATGTGIPYVVLEFVEGEPLLEHCHARGLGLAERLQLFRKICAAVDYAHRNLVVHRDLKPGNILVTPEGVPKLLDFGIAKLLEPESVSEAEGTGTLFKLMTPQYASPEQFGGGPITTATDVYSLGVILYELLTAQRPYRFGASEPHEIARIVLEQEPSKPSVRVTQPGSESASVLSRQASPRKLARHLRGDLDTIVMMAMRKEPERRYASVQQMSDDILRHLERRPILARKDTLAYRSGKFIRRHRVAVAAAVLVAMALGAGFVLTVHERRLADFQRARAERRFNDVRRLAGSFLFEFHDAIETLPGSTPARALIVKRGLEYLDSLARESGGDRGLRRELAAAYQKVGDVQGGRDAANLGDTAGALKSYRKALEMRETLAAQAPGNADLAGELAATLDAFARTLSETGDKAGSFEAFGRALKVRQAIVAKDPRGVAARRALATSYHNLASGLVERGQYREALSVWRREVDLFETLWKENPADRRAQRNVALSYKYTGGTLEQLGDRTSALDLYRKAVALDEARSAADPTNAEAKIDLSYSYGAMSVCLMNMGDSDGALAIYRKAFAIRQALAEADPKDTNARAALARAYLRIGDILEKKGEIASALESFRKAQAIEERLSKNDPANETARTEVAVTLNRQGHAETALAAAPGMPAASRAEHWREARSIYRRSLDMWQDLSRRGVLGRSRAGEPDRVAKEIALCDAALKGR